jgi:4-hydroxybutyryl-CoA dehydratase/vinylacetyl-CoA-Delta-isomerase
MKTGKEYLKSVNELEKEVYLLGERQTDVVDHPILRPSVQTLAMTYDLATDPDHEPLMLRRGLEGPTNLFCSIHASKEDLVSKVRVLRILGQKTGTCFMRCVGWDALNALSSVTYEIDLTKGTGYYNRFEDFLRHVQGLDLVCDGAMTDVKGDRSKRPHQQPNPDAYLRVVERRPDGVVVRGAKAHQTGSIFSHEIIVMPTRAMREEDRDYAISFAIPSDSPGLIYVVGRQVNDTRKLEGVTIDLGNANFGGHEALVIFNDVFVPEERIFMNGEFEFAGMLVERFTAYHRQSYGGCKVGVGDVLIGATALAAEYNGVEQASHIQHKLSEMISLNETLFSCGIACSFYGEPTPSGTYLVDVLLANVCKLNVTRSQYAISRLAEDIAGGLIVTMPSEKDLRHPEIGPLIEKYLKGVAECPAEWRIRALRLVENLTIGTSSMHYRTESMHGAGSPEAQLMMIARLGELEKKKAFAKDLAGIPQS